MRKKISIACFLLANGMAVGNASAQSTGDFTNGGFETGTLAGWTQGGGLFTSNLTAASNYTLNPSNFVGGTPTNAIVSAGNDPILALGGVTQSMVYGGSYAVRVNDSKNNQSVSTISQRVDGYGSSTINFAWSAVLQSASNHTQVDTDNFTLKVVDNTTNQTITSISYNASNTSTASIFHSVNAGSKGLVYYTGWQTVSINVNAGDSYTISLLAADCNAGGHFGYVYLDGFGVAAPTPGVTPPSGSIPNIVADHNQDGSYNKLSTVGAGTHTNLFDGGTLKIDGTGTRSAPVSSSADFTIAATPTGGTGRAIIDQNNNYASLLGTISDDTSNGRLILINGAGTSTTGKVYLSGGNLYSGGTEVHAGATLSIDDPTALGSGGLALIGSSTVPAILETTTDITISAPITVTGDPIFSVAPGTTTTVSSAIANGASAGDVVVSGGGTLALTAANTYTGLTAVDAGSTLALVGDGSISYSSALNNNGTVDIRGANGNVLLGNSTTTSTFTQTSTGSLLMNISPTNNQKVLVTGAASLAGGLSLAATAGTYAAGKYTLITANGVSGKFETFSTTLPTYTRLGYALGYDANNVYLYLTPNVSDTQQSLVNTAAALQNTYTLQNSVLANSFYYDCNLFDVNNICVSAGGRNTAIQASNGLNNTSALLIASYRLDKNNSRIGAYADQNLSVNNGGSTVNLGNNTPLIGLFAAWNQRPDGTGAEVKAGIAYGQKNTTITRQVVGTSEPGSGSSQLNSQGAQLTAKYGFGVMENVIVSPYIGMRYTQSNMGGYSEAASPSVTSPLTYSALNTNATTALAGVGASYRFIPRATVFGSAGVESDTNTANGTYAATGLSGLTPVNFNPNPVKTRPTATIGATYDVEKNQRIGITGIYRQEPFQAVSSTTVIATYTIGL